MNQKLFEAVDFYISDHFAKEDQLLIDTLQATAEANMPLISVSPTQGKLLYLLAKLCNAKNILEIGTLAGYSTIWMARALPEDGKLTTIELDEKHAGVARQNIKNAGLEAKVDVLVGPALELLPELGKKMAQPYDLVFIDADKPPYGDYFNWAIKLSRKGGLIIADNVVRSGFVLDKNSTEEKVKGVQRFNEMLSNNPDVDAIILPMVGMKGYDGIALAIVK